mgnify:CR=1 FL=1
MSKNIRKKPSVSDATEQQIKREDAERAQLEQRAHEFTTRDDSDENAPAGRGHSTARQVTGPTVFDAIEDLSSVGQITAYRSLANGALCGAVFAINERLTWTGPTEDNGQLGARGLVALARYERLAPRIGQMIDLHNFAALQLAPLIGDSAFDASMTLDEAIDFACNNAGLNQDRDALPAEVLEALGLSALEVAAIDAEEATKRAAEGVKLRASFRENADAIKAELENQIDLALGSDDVTTSFNAMQHRAMLQKTQRKLATRLKNLVAARNRYSGAISDAMLISADVRALDKAFVHFCRANAGELAEDTADA